MGWCKTRLLKVAGKRTGWGLEGRLAGDGCGWLEGGLAVGGWEKDWLWVARKRTDCGWLGGGLTLCGPFSVQWPAPHVVCGRPCVRAEGYSNSNNTTIFGHKDHVPLPASPQSREMTVVVLA